MKLFLIFNLLVFSGHSLFAMNPVLDAQKLLCRGEVEEGKSLLRDLLRSNPNNYAAYDTLNYFLPEDIRRNYKLILERIERGEEPASNRERLYFAETILEYKSKNMDKAFELLSFSTKNSYMESNRLIYSATISSMREDYDASILKDIEAFKISPLFEPELLFHYVYYDQKKVDELNLIRILEEKRNKFSEQSIGPVTLNYTRELLTFFKNGSNLGNLISSFEKVYSLCSISRYHALTMATVYQWIKQYKKSIDILLDLEKKYGRLDPHYYLQIAKMLDYLEEDNRSLGYLDKFYKSESEMFISRTDKQEADELKNKIESKKNKQNFWSFFVLGLLLVISIGLYLFSNLRKNRA